ncbi:MAG TPA: DNA polymerase III subunit gamma/tau, partial [Thermoanaerobaculia bacterium]|nr:DNA polymerase III subunit gamma/tau [Thermoanaerobaculia bacterium]
MTYQALARKYRPQTFSDILGQESTVRTLENSIEQNRIHQAYLFSGVRGVGKTTTARIMAKALNCAEGPTRTPCNRCTICREITEGIDLDVREIDAATYTQVENIRELREVTQFQPARDRNRIFIIDEAHMLSAGAWNALLKLIEEPPPHVVFMMATTEMQKVPQTILSRVQQFVFRRVTIEEVAGRLEEICRAEGIEAERDALEMIARRGEGSVRDALSLLDQTVAFSGHAISTVDVATILGLSDNSFFADLVLDIRDGNQARILETLEAAAESGRDFKLLFRDLLSYLRNLMLLAAGANQRLLQSEETEIEAMREVASQFEYPELVRLINMLIQDEELVYRSEAQRLVVEIAVLKAATLPRLRAIEDILAGSGADPAPGKKRSENPAPPRIAGSTARERSTAAPDNPSAPRSTPLGQQIVHEVFAQRRVAGSSLKLAREAVIEGDTVVFRFEPAHAAVVDQLSEPELSELIADVASRLRGAPTSVRLELIGDPARDAEPAGASDKDPVLQAFARHLG